MNENAKHVVVYLCGVGFAVLGGTFFYAVKLTETLKPTGANTVFTLVLGLGFLLTFFTLWNVLDFCITEKEGKNEKAKSRTS